MNHGANALTGKTTYDNNLHIIGEVKVFGSTGIRTAARRRASPVLGVPLLCLAALSAAPGCTGPIEADGRASTVSEVASDASAVPVERAAQPNADIIIGATDDRAYASDPRVGRLVTYTFEGSVSNYCTAWLTSTGLGLSASHCLDLKVDHSAYVEFDVPPSQSNGTPTPARKRFRVRLFDQSNQSDPGNDWLVFKIDPAAYRRDAAGNERPVFRLARVPDPERFPTAQLTGYGAYPSATPRDSRNHTEQTAVGPFLGECTARGGKYRVVAYQIDAATASSGSPVFLPGTDMAFGIHTNSVSATSGTCTTAPANVGTRVTNTNLQQAMRKMARGTGDRVIFVDLASPSTDPVANGMILNPYRSLSAALAAVAPGEATVLNIAPGHYAPNGIVIAASTEAQSAIVIGGTAGTIGIGPYPTPN